MITSANEILFRCSSLGRLMVEPREKSPAQQYAEVCEEIKVRREKLNAIPAEKLFMKGAEKQREMLERFVKKEAELRPLLDQPHLSQGTKTHLTDVFAAIRGRRKEAKGKPLEKGKEREEDSITLLSRFTKIGLNKNDERLKNEFIEGEVDTFVGSEIRKSKIVYDTKTSWSYNTFLHNIASGLDPIWEWQIRGYMELTGASEGYVAICCVNGTVKHILDEKRKAQYPYVDYENDPDYIEECKQIEINHIFDIAAFKKENPGFDFHNDTSKWEWDIPWNERIILFKVERDEEAIQRLYKRIEDCRSWMNANLFKPAA